MRLVFLASAAALAATQTAAAPLPRADPARLVSPVPRTCERIGSTARGEDRRPQARRLGELPPAEAYMAVYRRDSRGCLDPLLARDLNRPRGR